MNTLFGFTPEDIAEVAFGAGVPFAVTEIRLVRGEIRTLRIEAQRESLEGASVPVDITIAAGADRAKVLGSNPSSETFILTALPSIVGTEDVCPYPISDEGAAVWLSTALVTNALSTKLACTETGVGAPRS
jgi:hypothetical protein